MYAGVICGLAILTRPDSILLLGAILLFLMVRAARGRSWAYLSNAAGFGLAVALVLTPWIMRNYVSLGKFQPLASEYGFAQPAYMPKGYLLWVRTWLTVENEMDCLTPAFFPGGGKFFRPEILPDRAFDSVQERQRVMGLIDQYNQTHLFTAEINDGFRNIAFDRIKRAPVRFFLVLPARRVVYLWCQGFATSSLPRLTLRLGFLLSIILGGIVCFALVCRRSHLGALLILIILTKTIFMAYHYAPETRYIIEAYPAMIAACGVTGAVLWRYLNRRWITTRN
jgi:hypothetical protein